METLPNELLLNIIQNCSLTSLLLIRELSTKYFLLANLAFRRMEKIDFYSSYFHCDLLREKKMRLQKFAAFAQRNCDKLQELSFNGCPVSLTLENLIQLSKISSITKLDFGQRCHLPEIQQSALLALPYFKRLKSLNLDGLCLYISVGKGGKHHFDTPPLHRMPTLEAFSLTCKTGILFRTLQALNGKGYVMANLKSVRLGSRYWVTTHDSDFALLIWFLHEHASLEDIELSEFMFASFEQIAELWSALFRLRNLHRLSLKKCSSREAGDFIGFSPAVQCAKLSHLNIIDSAATVDKHLLDWLKRHCPTVTLNEHNTMPSDHMLIG